MLFTFPSPMLPVSVSQGELRYNSWRQSDAYMCVYNLTMIGSDNGLSPDRRQAINWTNAGILLNGTLRTNFSEFLIQILPFLFKKMHLKVSSAKCRPFCLGLNVITDQGLDILMMREVNNFFIFFNSVVSFDLIITIHCTLVTWHQINTNMSMKFTNPLWSSKRM